MNHPDTLILPTCRHGHRLVKGNLISMGDKEKCQRCNRIACKRWGARHRLVEFADVLQRISAEAA